MSLTGGFERLLVAGAPADVRIRVDGRAKRISIRVDRVGGGITLTAPSRAMIPEARRFLKSRASWVEARKAEAVEPSPFVDGAKVPVQGTLRAIVHDPAAPDPVRLTESAIIISGDAELLPTLLTKFFKAEARRALKEAAERHAATLGLNIAGLTIRDQKTRWGSCSSSGKLSFSWRLAMAPAYVLEYLAAHETAHLRHMNHGPKFWKLVEALDSNCWKAEDWLKRHGPNLRRYG